MKRFAVQSKLVGTAALVLVSLPVFAQSPVSPPPAAPAASSALPPLAPIPAAAPGASAPAGDLPALNLPTVAVPAAANTPAAPAPDTALPAVTAPAAATPATSATADGQAAANPASAELLPQPKQYSFGDSELSILFLPDQVSRMKDAIRSFEDTGKDAEKPTVVPEVVAAPVAPEIIEDPLVYPVFYLSTIAYDAPSDWSLWVSGYKITSRRNYTDLTVLNVTRDSVTFLWKPSFMKAIAKREKEKRFAPIDSVKHKLVPAQAVSIDPAAGSVVFTLKPNQSFAPGYFKTFEGYIDGPTLTALPVVVAGANAGQVGGSLPTNEPFDANGNPVDGGVPTDSGQQRFAQPSTNFNPPAR